jgi:pilus assembly protein CpaB
MDRNTRTMVVVGIAIVVAALASFSVYRLVQRMPARVVAAATTQMVVAAENLPLGTRLTKEQVKLVDWPAGSMVPGGFTSIDAVVNRGLIAGVSENEPLTESKVAPLESGAGLPPTIPPGMRAISVKVNEVIGVAGFVVPGTRVDVMVVLRKGAESVARVVVSNAQVLTSGTRYDQEAAKDGKQIPSSVVTLLVAPEDAERIGLAASEGQVMLTLRNPLDQAATESAGVQLSTLSGQPVAPPTPAVDERPREPRRVAAPAPAPVVEAPPASKIYTVETIRAAKRTEETIK